MCFFPVVGKCVYGHAVKICVKGDLKVNQVTFIPKIFVYLLLAMA